MKTIGTALWIVCGIVLYVFEIIWLFRWWGDVGAIVGVLVPPISVVFPFLYLLKEGFSIFYFGLWGIGVVGLVVASLSGDS